MTPSRLRSAATVCFYVAVTVVTVLALLPSREAPLSMVNDKLQHLTAFSCLMFLAQISRGQRAFSKGYGLFLFGLGVGIECLQFFSPGRTPELRDVIADSAGIAVGYLLWVGARNLPAFGAK